MKRVFGDIGRRVVIAAPMAGYTDRVFRRFARKFGADLTFTEMVSAEGLVHSTKMTLKYIEYSPDEAPIGIQFFSASPEYMRQAASMVKNMGFSVIDINMGCPVRKVMKKGAGAALLANPAVALKVVEAAKSAGLPVSVKIRCGVKSCAEWKSIKRFVAELEKIGIEFLTIHPRSAAQMYSGESDWRIIRDAVQSFSLPIIGSGDLLDIDAVRERVEFAAPAGVMIARGAIANFEIFTQVRAWFEGKPIPRFSLADRARTLLEFIRQEVEFRGETQAVKWSRKFLSKLFRGFPGASNFRAQLDRLETLAQVEGLLRPLMESKFSDF